MDLGSGKGYLSQYLTLQYGLNVIGVDSSDRNTQNAAKRNERILKVWHGLVRKSQREKLNSSNHFPKESITSGYVDSQPQERTSDSGSSKHHSSELLSKCCTCTSCTSIAHCPNCELNNMRASNPNQACHIDEPEGAHMGNLAQNAVEAVNKLRDMSEVDVMEADHSKTMFAGGFQSSSPSSECQQFDSTAYYTRSSYRNKTLSTTCTPGCYHGKIPHSGPATNTMTSELQQSQSASPTSFVPVTGFVDQSFVANGKLARLFAELGTSDGVTTKCNGLFLVGLHTCGDLAPMALRIFVSEPSVKVVCIVGCCYHLVSQEFGSECKNSVISYCHNCPHSVLAQLPKPEEAP